MSYAQVVRRLIGERVLQLGGKSLEFRLQPADYGSPFGPGRLKAGLQRVEERFSGV